MIEARASAGLFAALLLVAGCAAAPPDRGAVAEPEEVDCEALTELDCIASAECTLRLDESAATYACTPAADVCEQGFVQRDPRPETCTAGCFFVPARCYCAPDVDCVCGGGPPALCLAEAPGDGGEAR